MNGNLRKLSGSVFYQIFLRNFCVEGTLDAAAKCLEHIASLGVDYIYLGAMHTADPDPDPRHYSPRNAQSGFNNPKNPYRISDYYHIDPEYGGDESFRAFVEKAHALGMGVLMDLVFYHCGPSMPLIQEHPEYFAHRPDGSIEGGHYNMCVFDFSNPGTCRYLTDVMRYWVKEFHVDGFRCDMGTIVPYEFWDAAVREVKTLNPDLIMLCESWSKGQPVEHMKGDAFDMKYGMYLSTWMKDLFLKNKLTVRELEEKFQAISGATANGKYSMTGLDCHDTVLDAWYERADAMLPQETVEAAGCLSFLTDAIPLIYNGVEIADKRRHSCFSNRFCVNGTACTVDWMNLMTAQGRQRLEYVRKMAALVHEHPAFHADAAIRYEKDVPADVIAFERESEDERAHVIINLSDREIAYTDANPARTLLWARNAGREGNTVRLQPWGFLIELKNCENI